MIKQTVLRSYKTIIPTVQREIIAGIIARKYVLPNVKTKN